MHYTCQKVLNAKLSELQKIAVKSCGLGGTTVQYKRNTSFVLLDFAHDGPLYGLIISVWHLRGEIFLRKIFEMNNILKFVSNISKINANVSPFNVVEEYLMMNERCFSFFLMINYFCGMVD